SLRYANLASSVAGRTLLRFGARLRSGAVACLAGLHCRNANLDVRTSRRFFEREIQVVAKIGAAKHAVAAAASRLTEYFTEDVAECVGESSKAFGTAEAPRAGCADSGRWIDARVPELIVSGALTRVGQNLVGFLRFLEFFFGSLVVRIAIRMEFHRELAIGFLDVLFGSVAIDAK